MHFQNKKIYYATPVFFIKYVLLIGPFIRCVTSNEKITKRDYPFFVILILYFIWGFIEFANFTLTSNFIVKALGFITHYWFISLIFLIPVFLNNEEKILRFFKILVVISIPIFILGIIQYNSPVYSEINKYVAEGVDIAKIGNKPRITTVFSYITPYTSFLGFAIMTIIYFLILKMHKLYFELILITAGGLGFINLFMTGSRGTLFFVLFKIGLLLIYMFKKFFVRRPKIIFGFIIFMVFGSLLISYTEIGTEAYSTFKSRLVGSTDLGWRVKDNYNFTSYISRAGIVGYGLGTTYQGSASLITDWKDMPFVESENSKIIVEMGFIGFLIIYLLRLSIFYYSYRVFKMTKIYSLKLLLVIIIIIQIPTVLAFNNVIYVYMENLIYWLIIGIVVSINRINYNNRRSRITNDQRVVQQRYANFSMGKYGQL